MTAWRGIGGSVVTVIIAATGAAGQVTIGSLLDEMVDRDALARWPAPAYTCRQASSYDRRATTPDDPATWFANGDANQYIRQEERDGRTEWVMMDEAGPGAIVRIWSANPQGTMRIYLDGADTPAIEADMAAALGGKWAVAGPLSAVRSRGWNLYLPIPYASHCKVTSDKPGFYYQINYRTYEAGTQVQSFAMPQLEAETARVDAVQEQLAAGRANFDPQPAEGLMRVTEGGLLEPGQSVNLSLPGGSHAVRFLSVGVKADDPAGPSRTLVVEGEFDGQRTIWAPVGDFFGSGIGANEYTDWYRSVLSDGTFACAWVMPYESTASLRVTNLGDAPVEIEAAAALSAWTWDDRSMHFWATWRQENPIKSRPFRDWNYVEVRGRGVYVGDVLCVANPVENWWGEGDEKIYVDGETFPSHFGTGTEDYYGYAWCCPEVFVAPFHAQPRCDGPGNYGHTTVTRVRSLDAIPFTESVKMDIEVWHSRNDVEVGYAGTSYFYARPGATTNRQPAPEEAARGPIDPAPLPPPFTIDGAIECEEMEISAKTEDVPAAPQGGFGPRTWSGERHLWVQGKRTGDFIELRFPAPDANPRRVTLYATKSWDYGIVRITLNGTPDGEVLDLYNPDVVSTGPIDLGVVAPVDGAYVLRAEVIGANEESRGTKSFFGLDCVVLTAPED